MPFLSASFYNFRNLENATVDISSPEVFLVGKNGQGKTNFLEALYVSSYGTSFRTRSLAQICTKDEKELNLFDQVAEPIQQFGPSPQESFEQDYDLEVDWQDTHFDEVKHVFSHRKWYVRIIAGNVVDTKEYKDKEVVWLTPEEFNLYPLAKPQQKIWQEYLKRDH